MAASGARDVARRVLRRVEREEAYATLALGSELERSGLEDSERRLATELVYGVLRHRSRIDRALGAAAGRRIKVTPAVRAALRVAGYQLLFLDRVPTHAAVNDAVGAVKRLAGPRVAGFANGVLRRLARDGEPPPPETETAADRAAREASMPAWLVELVAERLPEDELVAACIALNEAPPLAIRVVAGAAAADVVGRELEDEREGVRISPADVCPGALVVRGLGSPERSPSFARGHWTVQDVGAQLVGHMVTGAPRIILDACAGVGGKTMHLASRFPDARIVAADRSATKLELLEEAAARLGVSVETRVADLAAPGPGLEGPFDAILLDAPCSGLGVMRRHPELKWRTPGRERIAELAGLQRRLVEAVVPRLAVGGQLVYSVCTFTDAESRSLIGDLLGAHGDLRIEAPAPGQGTPPWQRLLSADGYLETWPHRHSADAFTAVRLVRC